ncbi:MAG: AAA family ATPase [Desulfosalsimonadaceae bacterium]
MYLEYYHLSQKPFQINTDPAFLWLGEKHKEALATLRYGLYENKSFLVLTGDIGVGKTTVINSLLQMLDKKDRVVAIHDPGLEKLDFFKHLADAYGIPGSYTSKGEFINAFSKFLLKSHYRGRRVLLIIDEAQLLTHELLEEIRLFSNLEKNGVKLINIFFVGQMEFNEILLRKENKAIRQRIAVNYNIDPLTLKETAKYVGFRLSVAGSNRKIFDAGAIREIYRFSNGYPRLINVIADRALLTGFTQSARRINRGIIRECATELDISRVMLLSGQRNGKNGNADRKSGRENEGSRLIYLLYPVLVALMVFILYYFSDVILNLFPERILLFLSGIKL